MSDSDPRQTLIDEIRRLKPWHQDIQLRDDLHIRNAFSEDERQRENNQNITMHSLRGSFQTKVRLMYPDGLQGKRFLDVACNAGAYCFWASEFGADEALGFDVRDHWIQQAKFVKQHRTIVSTDNVEFETRDLMSLPEKNLQPVDFTLFKGIFYHLADPILGLKIAADLTSEVLWLNTARCYSEDTDSLRCTFETQGHLMSGVHALSWMPSGPMVMGKLLYWMGFTDIRHVFSKQYEHRPKFGRMEIIAARKPGILDRLSEAEGAEDCEKLDFSSSINAKQASDDLKALF